jgi:acyl-CoA reductase-like NAD-dependent aldehyde dehydrogenase
MTPDPRGIVARLLAGGDRLRKMTVDERAAALAAVAVKWSDHRHPARAEAEELMTPTSRYSPPVIAAGLDRLFAAVTKEALIAWWARLPEESRTGPGLAAVVPAGNIPGVAFFPMMAALLAGTPVVVKVSRDEPHLLPRFVRDLEAVSPVPGAAVAAVEWMGGDESMELVLLGDAGRILAFGRDATLETLARRFPGRVTGYGAGLSIAVVSRERVGSAEAARGLALDMAVWDQHGCLSPRGAVVEGDLTAAVRFGEMLADALEATERNLPRGRLDLDAAARTRTMRAGYLARSVTGGAHLWKPAHGLAWTVAAVSGETFDLEGLDRTIVVHAIPRLEALPEILAPIRATLQAAGLAAPEARRKEIGKLLTASGFGHVTPLGTMQAPPVDWRNKGRDLLHDLLGVAERQAARIP